MTTETVAYYRLDPHRSTEAFWARIEDGQGSLVSEGSGVYQDGVHQRQTGLAPRIRRARG